MRGILSFAILAVKCSYSREIATALESADDVPDTLRCGGPGDVRVAIMTLEQDCGGQRRRNLFLNLSTHTPFHLFYPLRR